MFTKHPYLNQHYRSEINCLYKSKDLADRLVCEAVPFTENKV